MKSGLAELQAQRRDVGHDTVSASANAFGKASSTAETTASENALRVPRSANSKMVAYWILPVAASRMTVPFLSTTGLAGSAAQQLPFLVWMAMSLTSSCNAAMRIVQNPRNVLRCSGLKSRQVIESLLIGRPP